MSLHSNMGKQISRIQLLPKTITSRNMKPGGIDAMYRICRNWCSQEASHPDPVKEPIMAPTFMDWGTGGEGGAPAEGPGEGGEAPKDFTKP